jgi:DNA-binding NarL/FixJ family response regulator
VRGDGAAIRVLVAVREPLTAVGLRTVLGEAEGMECLPLPEDLSDLRSLVRRQAPDVLILDVAIRRDDPELVPDLEEACSETRVLVYVDHSPHECALRYMLELGGRAHLTPEAMARLDDCCLTSLRQRALGCVGTGARLAEVVAAVRTVARGEVAAAPWLASVAGAIHGATRGSAKGAAISVRELEIMTLLAEGLTNLQIAERLGIREQTVKNQVTRTMEKLGVHNRTEVGLLAARHHLRLVPDPEPGSGPPGT